MPRLCTRVLILGMGGLGDSIYARPFVRAHARHRDVWLSTPWPQLYTDIPRLHFVPPWRMALRCQQKNLRRSDLAERWTHIPGGMNRLTIRYMLQREGMTIAEEIEQHVGLPGGEFRFDLPDFGPSPVPGRVAVVRPVTVRREWANTARNPDPRYPARAAALLREAGYTVVGLGDIDEREEPALPPLPECDISFLRGELPVEQALALVQHASVVVGGIGWIVPASIAFGTPAVFIGGGQGGHNGPSVVTDPRMDTRRTRFLLPDDYCARCRSMRHECPKHISHFDRRFLAALAEVACSPRN